MPSRIFPLPSLTSLCSHSSPTEYGPAVVAAITMPLTYSIATGIGLGFITYALAKLISGKIADARPAVIVLAVLFAVKFAVG